MGLEKHEELLRVDILRRKNAVSVIFFFCKIPRCWIRSTKSEEWGCYLEYNIINIKYPRYPYADLQTAACAIFAVAGVWTGPHHADHWIKQDPRILRPYGRFSRQIPVAGFQAKKILRRTKQDNIFVQISVCKIPRCWIRSTKSEERGCYPVYYIIDIK